MRFIGIVNNFCTAMDNLNNFWSFIESKLYCKVPMYLQGLLKHQGFDSVVTIKALDDKDIQCMTSFVRSKGCYVSAEVFDLDDFRDYYSMNRSLATFEMLRGHQKLLKAIAAYVAQQVDSNGLGVFIAQWNTNNVDPQKIQATSLETSLTAIDPDLNPEDSILFVASDAAGENFGNGEDYIDRATYEEGYEYLRIKAILNKLTSEDLHKLSNEMVEIIDGINTKEFSKMVNSLMFEKAIQEPRLCAELCVPLLSLKDEGLFKKTLITKCQREFQTNVIADSTEKLKTFWRKYEETNDPDGKEECRANYQEEESKLRTRSIGTVRFIGELFCVGRLTSDIMVSCVESLLKSPSQEKLEFMCILLTVVGRRLHTVSDCKMRLDRCFLQMNKIVNQENPATKINSAVRFMIQDVIDFLKKNIGNKPLRY